LRELKKSAAHRLFRISKWLCSLVSAKIKPKSTYFSKEHKQRLLLYVVIRSRLSRSPRIATNYPFSLFYHTFFSM